MRSATKSGGSAQHTPSSEGTLTALESNQGIRGPEVDLTGRAEDACSVDSSSETWHHVEALDEVISASDSEGREVYIRGASPDRLSAKVLSKGFMEKDVAGPSAGPPISKAAKEIEKLSTPASATDNGLKSRPAEMHSSKRASAREMVPDGPNAQSDQQSPASGQAATVHKAGLLDANEGVNTQTPTVEGTGGKGSSSQDDAAGISEASQTTSVGKEDEESGHEGARRSQKERAQRSGSPDQGGGAWGWTSSWSKLTEQFREAASGAARDVQELTTSFQQVLRESFEDEEEETEGSQAEDTASAAKGELPPETEPASPGSEQRRKAILQKLEGDDTQLEAGLKVLDESVEQLTVGLKNTLGSLWGGARGVLQSGIAPIAKMAEKVEEAAVLAAKELVETVEEGVADVRGLSVVKAATSAAANTRKLGGMLAAKAESGIELLGRQAINFLEGTTEGFSPRHRMGASDELSFDHCFYIYGGRQSFEELEALGNECARLCNRLRTKLAPEGKARLDAAIASLGPLFDLQAADTKDGSITEADADEHKSGPVGRGHSMLAKLCSTGVTKAEELAEKGIEVTALETGAGEVQEGQDDDEEAEDLVEVSLPVNFAASRLEELKAEGVRRLSELASLCIERLLALGRSVSASFRHGGANDGIRWPESPEEKAAMLRFQLGIVVGTKEGGGVEQARRMLMELEALTHAFVQALAKVGSAVQTQAGAEADGTTDTQGVVADLSKGLEQDLSSAVGRVAEAFRGLLYVVLLAAQDREVLQAS